MTVELVKDEFGVTMELLRLSNGRLGATDFIDETISNLRQLLLRQDDIMLCSYPKSGCHWLWEVLRYLVFVDVERLDAVDKEAYMVEFNSREQLAALRSPRILNNHCLFEEQPEDLLRKKIKTVLVYRNPKDTAVSFYYHHTRIKEYKYQDIFSNYLRRLLAGQVDDGSMFDYLGSWEAGILQTPDLEVHILSYEDMKENPVREVARLNEFLGTNRDEQFLLHVAQVTDFEPMQKRKSQVTMFLDDTGQPVMYRKGQVGDWKNHFSVADNEWMDEMIEKQLGQSQLFKFRYTLNP